MVQSTTASQTKKGLGGFSGWINALLGKKKSTNEVVKQVEAQLKDQKQPQAAQETVEIGSPEDSVAQDIQNAKKLVSGVIKGISNKVEPVAEAKIKKAKSSSILKKILKLFLILIFLAIFIFVAIMFVRTLGKPGNGGNGVNVNPSDAPTPTPFVYNPYKPSIYANDPEILALEQDITLLEKEIFRAILREDKLFPPVLNFKVDFK